MPPLPAPAVRRRPARGTVLLVAALTTAGLCAGPAARAVSGPDPDGTGAPTGAVTAGTAEDAPIVATQADLDAQQRRLEELQAQAGREGDALAAAQLQLQVAAARANVDLERSSDATRVMLLAQADERNRTEHLDVVRLEVADQRRQLARWAREAYVQGPLNSHPALVTVLSAEPGDDLAGSLQVLRQVGRSQQRMLRAAEQAGIAQVAAVAEAGAASERAEQAAVEAATAKAGAAKAVAEQRALVLRLTDTVAGTRDQVGLARQRAGELRDALARRAAQEAAAASAGTGQSNAAATGNRVTGPVGDCAGGDPSGYPNGQIPAEVLCPLASAPAHRLRADAAYAYDQLADAYAARFGTPLCITDSYRSLAVQERTYAAKPGLAAVPGTSNHGWGTAVDLCGGIQNFGTAQHEWMLTHAPLFSWFHPAWAGAGGSRPEPWHWEYGG